MKKYIYISIVLFISFSLKANTYFVSTNGNDANAGTEIQSWRTIQKAANTVIAGDTVYIKSGTYNERVIIQNSGNTNNYIVFSAYQNDNVLIDGNGISWGSSWNGLLDISDKSYIKIIGLTIQNSDYAGIFLENSTNIELKNNYIYNTFSSGIGVWNSNDIVVENNEVELACNDGGEECISVANSYNCEIFENNVHNNGAGTNGGEGIDVKDGSYSVNVYKNNVHHLNKRLGIYADAWNKHTYDINIFQNTVHHCSESGIAVCSENGGLIENVNIYNNIIYYNKYGGIELGSWSDIGFTGTKPLKHIKIINNTCYRNGDYDNGWGYGIVVDNPDAEDIIIRNNICSSNSAQIAITQINNGGIIDHNLFYGNNNAQGTLYGTDSIIGNPLFVDTLSFNFNIEQNSPVIDNANPVNAPNVDFEDKLRPNGSGYDIGAYEFYSTLNINKNNLLKEKIKLYPNPANKFISISMKTYNKNYSLKLFDINGQLLKNIRMRQNPFNLDLSNIKPGFYVLFILEKGKIISTKNIILE